MAATTRFGRALGASALAVAAVTALGTTAGLTILTGTPPAELSLPTFGGGGETSSSDGFGVQSILGQPEAEASEGGTFALVPGPVVASLFVTDACPGADGSDAYAGCRAGIRVTTVLHTRDSITPMSFAQAKVFKRDKLQRLTITTREGAAVTLSRNPDDGLLDDIFESSTAASEAGAATFGCTADATGTCTAGVSEVGDLLVIVRFPDGTKTVYAGRSLDPGSFVDGLATETVQVQKHVAKDGAVSYPGGKVVVV